jgi:uncharacterized membrane protein
MNKIFRFLCIFLTTKLAFILLSNLLRKEKSFTLIIKNWCSTVLASFTYFIPLSLTIMPYLQILKAMGYVRPLLKDQPTVKNLNPAWNLFEPRIIDIFSVGSLYNVNQSLMIPLFYYFIIYKGRRNKNTSYFIKFHLMHSILLVIILLPLGIILVALKNSQIGGKTMQMFWEQLGYISAIANFSAILYCMFSAAINNYLKLPVFTEGAKLHLGPNMSK